MDDRVIVGAIVDRLRAEFAAELLGVLVGGSRVRGEAGPNSDLDVVVIVARSQRRRQNVIVAGIEVEMFIDPPLQMRRYFEEGRRNGRGQLQHLCATGCIVFDPQGVMSALQAEARASVQEGPPALSERERWQFRYAVADALRDIDDVANDDPDRASLLLGLLLAQLFDQHYRIAGRWLQKRKKMLSDLTLWDEPAARLARRALNSASALADRCAAVRALADHVLAPLGGIMPTEWCTDWEAVSPEGAGPSDLLPAFTPLSVS